MTDPHDLRILLAGIEEPSASALVSAFAAHGSSPMLVSDPRTAARQMQELPFDLLVTSQVAVEQQRAALTWPPPPATGAVLVLGDGAVDDLDDRVHASIPSDASAREVTLVAWVLVQQQVPNGHRTQRCGRITLDLRHRTATLDDVPLPLTRLELRIVQALAEANGDVVSRADLERLVWGYDPVDGGARIAAHIRRLRAKLDATTGTPGILVTVRGEGFRLATDLPLGELVIT